MKKFLNNLKTLKLENCFNPWTDISLVDDAENGAEIRFKNLETYLSKVTPKIICLGEACGFQGACKSGLAFTDISLRNDFEPLSWLQDGTNGKKRWNEPSARSVWPVIGNVWENVLLWNIFPLHPHGLTANSNRTPKKTEVQAGWEVTKELLELYKGAIIVSIGKTSHNFLNDNNIKNSPVRHPAYGGKPEFQSGLSGILTKVFGYPVDMITIEKKTETPALFPELF